MDKVLRFLAVMTCVLGVILCFGSNFQSTIEILGILATSALITISVKN